MKKGAILTIFLALTTGVMQAQDEPTSAMVFDSYEWDFGTIDEADGPVSHTFHFINISDAPIQIDNVATSCGCTYADYSTQPIQGGEEGEITVILNPSRQPEGRIFREVEILTKDRKNYVCLSIFADIKPIPMGLEQIYPHLLAGTVKTNTLRCNFGYVAQGETTTKVVNLANVGDKPVKLSVQSTGNRYGMTVQCPEAIDPQEVTSLRITYTIPKGKNYFGMARDTLWLVADGAKSLQPIAITALRVEEFSDKDNKSKPVMRIEPSYVEFGIKAPGKTFKKNITIGNTGNADLIFHDVEACEGTTTNLKNGQKIRPGEEIKVMVTITNSTKANETTMGSINLTTNDPLRPFRELRLQIDTK
ncbi:MAG: DUF1573 domain-containing protein [Bacteroidaceae bacterium]|nr:DUF1573 domain-containing protein [Bacteroidaceae bacterium]